MKYKAYTKRNYRTIPQLAGLPEKILDQIDITSRILPFKTSNYIVDELIDWNHWETDPLFMLTFPQKKMLDPRHFDRISGSVKSEKNRDDAGCVADSIRMELNPHPAGQLEYNIPMLGDLKLNGIQHKYRETMLVFPAQGQTCHAYCTFCFRWPQFSGMNRFKIELKHVKTMVQYLELHPEITDVLITGGDPMIMSAKRLATYVDALLESEAAHLKTIRIGTRTLSFWPYRYLTDRDSRDILKLFKKITDRGIHLSVMAHINHHREMTTPAFAQAVKEIRATGANIRSQSPVLNHINDSPEIWKKLWSLQVNHGIIPYYMFIPRNTGASSFFSLPLARAYYVFTEAYSMISGLARTVKGPVMSSFPGKIKIDGIPEINREKTFALSFVQARSPQWTNKPFFARFDPEASWLSDLKPAFGNTSFFFEKCTP